MLVNPLPLKCQHLERGQNVSNYCSHRSQKAYRNPWFRCFSLSWRAHQRRRITVFRPQLEGTMRHDGLVGGQYGRQQGSTETTCKSRARRNARRTGWSEPPSFVKMPPTGCGDRLYTLMGMPVTTRARHLNDPCKASARPVGGIVIKAPPILLTRR